MLTVAWLPPSIDGLAARHSKVACFLVKSTTFYSSPYHRCPELEKPLFGESQSNYPMSGMKQAQQCPAYEEQGTAAKTANANLQR